MVTKAQTATPAAKTPRAATTTTAAARKPAAKRAATPAPKVAIKATPAPKAAAKPAAKPAPKAAVKPAPKPGAPKPAAAAPAPVAKADKKAGKPKKVKQVRDSFTMPENEYAVLAQVKKTCLKAGVEIKKSDLLRIGVSLIKNLKIADIQEILAGLTPLKVGRPKK